jgi:S-DNA-T family DNA segregation ATPase FtsK/SpoIIIE
MDRRFDLIESMNVRNIEGYNKAIANDPNKEKLPQIVIVIDELADLMMTASNEVETSICRIAQKARAAGMHLIIGTQRPSVDVITGLIKANVPSRIAFTVMSQVDSRTIIDQVGAEKLVGRGDMLYAPVGSKPMRAQGAFVSDNELEGIIDFIKENSKKAEYSNEIISRIDKEAALCGKKGKARDEAIDAMEDDGEEEDDPKLDAAIKLAVEQGKISTSLIQRKLSLGYGRAAKIIDVMERRGIVAPPDGQKPREVLISKEQYLEMSMRKDGAAGAMQKTAEIPSARQMQRTGEMPSARQMQRTGEMPSASRMQRTGEMPRTRSDFPEDEI